MRDYKPKRYHRSSSDFWDNVSKLVVFVIVVYIIAYTLAGG